jgi:acetylornithine/succinyldiaminopimelate/putrescine aminotransferase
VQVVDTDTAPGLFRIPVSSERPFELLAAKNATLRLRAASGHVFPFTDLTSARGAVNFGHLNPAIDPFLTLASDAAAGFFPPSAAAFSAWLLRKLQLQEHTVFYRIGAGGAVNAAIAMAQQARPGAILTIAGSSHAGLRSRANLAADSVVSLAPGAEFSAWEQISCLVYEPVQNGGVPLPLPWLRGLSQSAQAAGVPVIADEIECGFYRFGKLSLAASEYLRPDVFLFGNSMTNGFYPAAAMVCPAHLPVDALEPADGPFQTSALGFQAAEAVSHYIDSIDIEAQIAPIYAILSQSGERLAANPNLGAFHLAGPTLSFEVYGQRAAELLAACQARGVLVGAGANGRRIVAAPPLTISGDQLTNSMDILEQAAGAL